MEILFEVLTVAEEVTPGTAVTPPTHYIPLVGAISPVGEIYQPDEARGTAARHRQKIVRRTGAFSAEGGADPLFMPFLGRMILNGTVSAPTTPGVAAARLWTFPRSVTSNTLKTATILYGDPNMDDMWQGAYGYFSQMVVAGDSTTTDGVTLTLEGGSRFPALVTPPVLPAQLVGDLLTPGNMQVWLDTSLAIGTTEITSRTTAATATVPSGLTPKYTASGPGVTPTYSRMGLSRQSPTAQITVEVDDLADEYALYAADSAVKLRIRFNGDAIAGETGLYSYIQFDFPNARFDGEVEAGENEGVNRLLTFNFTGLYDTTAATDVIMAVQNTSATI